MHIHTLKRRDWLTLLLILFVASLLRFGQPGIVEFYHDEAMLSTLAQQMAAGETFPLTGINSSTGIPNPPISVYIMMLPYLITSDPQVATLFVMGLNVVGVGLLWLFGHRYFGQLAGLVAGLTYAVSPWAVLYSRKIWAQDFHTPFILLGLLLGLYGYWEASPRATGRAKRSQLFAQALCLPILLLAMQIHFAAWALLPLYLLILWQGRERIRWRAFIASVVLSALVMLPYAVGLSQTLQEDPTRISAAAERSEAVQGLHFSLDVLSDTAYLITGYGLETWIAPNQQSEMLTAVPSISLWWLIGVVTLLGIVRLLWQKSLRRYAAFMMIWAFLPPLALILQWTPVYPHYFIASIPAYALLAGLGVAWIARWVPLKRTGQAIILSAYVVILLTQAMWWRGALRYIDENGIEPPGFTVPLHDLRTIADDLAAYDDVLVLSYGMSWSLHHESAVWPVLLRDTTTCVRTLMPEGYAVFPQGAFAVLVAPDAPANPVNGLYTQGDSTSYPTRYGETPYVLYSFEQAPTWNGPAITDVDPISYDIGVNLTGYALAEGRIYLRWQLPASQEDVNYQYSAQLFDAEERIGQADTVFWQQRHWCAGDTLITWAPIDQGDRADTLQVSLYRLGTGSQLGQFFNANVLDAAGAPAGQYAVIPLE